MYQESSNPRAARNEYRRADYRFVPSQWETALLCNDVSHWLGANLQPALVLGARPVNERGRYFVTTSLIGWAQTLNQSWYRIDTGIWRHGTLSESAPPPDFDELHTPLFRIKRFLTSDITRSPISIMLCGRSDISCLSNFKVISTVWSTNSTIAIRDRTMRQLTG